jgi:hypothetical protein
MPISEDSKKDVLLTVSIEMERMFTILSNYYGRPQEHDIAEYVQGIEKELKTVLGLITHRDLETSPSNRTFKQ